MDAESSPSRPTGSSGDRSFRLAAALTLLLGLLLFLNLPFYAGCSVSPHSSWRMEHGRLGLRYHPELEKDTSFYIAPNSEGLRWAPDLEGYGGGYELQIPLWTLLALSGACTLLLHRRLD